MQDANGRQYKREMASFEVGSGNASAMAGSVLRDERAPGRGGNEGDGRDLKGDGPVGGTGAWHGSEERKRSVPVTYEMEMTVPCVAPLAFISGESNSIARTRGDPGLRAPCRCGRT
jgi:hypothetical protein